MKNTSAFLFLGGFIAAVVLSYALNIGTLSHIGNTVTTYTPTDMEVNFFGALNAYRGHGMYNVVSSIYPPGRAFAIAEFFENFGASVPTLTLYFNFVAPFLYPILLYVLTFQILKTTALRKGAEILALLPIFVDWMFVRSAQEVHVISALFFVALMSNEKVTRIRLFVLGMLLGIIPLFRIEAFIATVLGLGITYMSEWRRLQNVRSSVLPFIAGVLTVLLPITAYMIYHNALLYALHDLLYLALIAQPKVMAQPIQVDHISLFTGVVIFLMASALALFVQTRNKGIRVFAIFSVVSFATALNLSDEGHLWYGALWISVYVVYALSLVSQMGRLLRLKAWGKIVVWTAVFIALGTLTIQVKSPGFFVLLMAVLFAAVEKWIDGKEFLYIHVAGLIATVLVFHSLSYVQLRYRPLSGMFVIPEFNKALYRDDENEIAGLIFPKEHMDVLQSIQSDIPDNEEYLFIFPDHVLYYEFFKQQNPTRYYHFTSERTPEIGKHIIQQIKDKNARYILLFPTKEFLQDEEVYQWIQANTNVAKTYQLDGQAVELRVRR